MSRDKLQEALRDLEEKNVEGGMSFIEDLYTMHFASPHKIP